MPPEKESRIAMLPVEDVAKFIIMESERVSNLKLQKLLYYVQGWHLGIVGKPIFNERLEAWVHGPVVPPMFSTYKIYRWQTIPKPLDHAALPIEEAKHIRNVLKVYNKYAADQLERLSHSEKPWLAARAGLAASEPSNAVITHASMREFFAARAKA